MISYIKREIIMRKIILTYHRVGEVATDYNNTCITKHNFNRQMIQLKNHFLVLPMKEFLQYKGDKSNSNGNF